VSGPAPAGDDLPPIPDRTGLAAGLDHVGVVGPDLDALAATFAAFGFRLTPQAAHAGGRTGNRCAMLRSGGYLELMAVLPGGHSATLERFLAHHAGAHTLALETPDAAATVARLRGAGVAVSDPIATERRAEAADPASPLLRFEIVMPPDRPEGRLLLVQHRNRSDLWETRFLDHPNGAIALEEVVVLTEGPAALAAAWSVLAGRPVVPDPAGGFALALPTGRVRMMHSVAALCGGQPVPPAPCIAAVTLRTADRNGAVKRVLDEAGIGWEAIEDTVVTAAGGLILRFRG